MATGQTYKNAAGQTIDTSTGLPVGQIQPGLESTSVPAINSSTLQSVSSTPQFEAPAPIAVPDVSQIGVSTGSPTPQLSTAEQQAQDLFTRSMGLESDLLGRGAAQTEAEKAQGIAAKQQALTDAEAAMNLLRTRATAIPLELQQQATGRGITAGGLAPIQTAALRSNAIEALYAGAQLEAARGNLTTAQNLADRAVEQVFGPKKAALEANDRNLARIMASPAYTEAQKARAQAQTAANAKEARNIAKQEADLTAVQNMAITARKYGASDDVVRAITAETDPMKALVIAGQSLTDPAAKVELEGKKLDLLLKNAQIDAAKAGAAQTRRETELLGQETPAQRAARIASEAVISDKKRIADAAFNQNKSDLITSNDAKVAEIQGILDPKMMKALDSVVHTTASGKLLEGFAKIPVLGVPALPKVIGRAYQSYTGGSQKIISAVEQLTSQKTLATLLALKTAGGTLGALSEGERVMLDRAGSQITSWRVTDNGKPDGKVIGYDIDPATFKAELEKMQKVIEDTTKRALAVVFMPEESSAITNYYDSIPLNEGAPTDASAYFSN
jgi:hypothetical protein